MEDAAYTIPTVRQVLNHTAGLGTYFDIYYSDQEDAYTSFEDAWEDYGIVFNQPGLVSEYSNIGYGLLQFIIEKQSNLTFDQFLQQEIFLPLGMTDASVLTGQAYPSIARKYDTHGEPLPEVWNNTAGAGNVAASLFDVFKFAAWFMSDSDEHLSKELRNEMMTYVEPGGLFHYYESTKYGLGWYFKHDGQKRVVWHEGGMTGASSMLRMFPDEDVAIVVLTNTFNSPVVRALTDQISELIFENYQPKPLNEVAEYKEVADDSLFIGSWIGSVNTGTQQWPVRLHVSGESIDLEVEGMERQSWLFGLSNEQRLIGTGMGSTFMHFDRSERTNIWSYKLLYDEGKLVGSIVLLGYGEREYFAYPFAITLERE